jgi:hypothetical protein
LRTGPLGLRATGSRGFGAFALVRICEQVTTAEIRP